MFQGGRFGRSSTNFEFYDQRDQRILRNFHIILSAYVTGRECCASSQGPATTGRCILVSLFRNSTWNSVQIA